MTDTELKTLINAAIDYDREQRGLTNDRDLGKKLGNIPQPSISRWRRLLIPKAARILIPMVCAYCHAQAHTHAEPS